jgi:hypothetical protein
MKKWIINIFGFVIGYLLSFIIIQTVHPSPLTDEIQRLYDEGKIDEVTAKILEHEHREYISRAMIAKCNKERCEVGEIVHHALNLIYSDRKKRNGHRYGFTSGALGFRDSVLVGLFTHGLIKAFEDPVRERVRASKESWERERENERQRIRYRERERRERNERDRRDKEKERNELIRRNRY